MANLSEFEKKGTDLIWQVAAHTSTVSDHVLLINQATHKPSIKLKNP